MRFCRARRMKKRGGEKGKDNEEEDEISAGIANIVFRARRGLKIHRNYDEISKHPCRKLRFYACYRLRYYIAGIPSASGMAPASLDRWYGGYVRVYTCNIPKGTRYSGHLWKFDREQMQASYQLFTLLSRREITGVARVIGPAPFLPARNSRRPDFP